MDHAYWGPGFSNAVIGELLTEKSSDLSAQGCSVEQISDEAELCRRTAEAIADGQVIGWFQGRLEWGPRALGNRSILGDPRRADMKDILNLKIKRRESFRPFAPSVLREAVPEWFEQDAEVPFMMQVFQIREDKRALIPAVAHDYARNTAKLDVFCLTDHLEAVDDNEWLDTREVAWDANEDGKFAIGLCITVQDGAPARLKVKCSISKKVTDEIESQIEDFDPMKLSL
jgi:hypothetical protein